MVEDSNILNLNNKPVLISNESNQLGKNAEIFVGTNAEGKPMLGTIIDAEPNILFGQRRASPNFSPVKKDGNGPPPYLAGRSIIEVADDLIEGRLHPDQLPIEVFYYEPTGEFVSANTRTLGALSLAKKRPTVIKVIEPNKSLLNRMKDKPLISGANLPSPFLPITEKIDNPNIIYTITLPGYK